MAIGQLTSFPLSASLSFADSTQKGLAKTYKSSVNSTLANCASDTAPSELAIRKALNDIDVSVQYQNLGNGYGIYKDKSGNIANFNTLSESGIYTNINKSGNVIIVSGYSMPAVTGEISTSSYFPSVQGGKYQYTRIVDTSDIGPSGCLIASCPEDDVIGKIFVKCIQPDSLLPDYEWNDGINSTPTNYTFSGNGSCSNYNNNLKMVNVSGNVQIYNNNYNETNFLSQIKGKPVTVFCQVYTTVSNQVFFDIIDDTGTQSSNIHTGSGTWETLSASYTISVSATYCYIVMRQNNTSGESHWTVPVVYTNDINYYSIGCFDEPEKYAYLIPCQNSEGLVEGWMYGEALSGNEYCWLSGDSQIFMYSNREFTSYSGKLGVSVFYDHIDWAPYYGYILGGYNDTDYIQRFNLSNKNITVSDRCVQNALGDYSAVSSPLNIYVAGGRETDTALTGWSADINLYYGANDTVSFTSRSSLVYGKGYSAGVSDSALKGYFAGGHMDGAATNEIRCLIYSTDTTNAAVNCQLSTSKYGITPANSYTYAYFNGGVSYDNTNYKTIEYMSFSTNTACNTSSSVLTNSKCFAAGFQSVNYSYIIGGFTAGITKLGYTDTDLMNFSTGTISNLSSFLTIAIGQSSNVQKNREAGWLLSGKGGTVDGESVNIVQQVQFSTNTVSINNVNVIPNSAGYGASL